MLPSLARLTLDTEAKRARNNADAYNSDDEAPSAKVRKFPDLPHDIWQKIKEQFFFNKDAEVLQLCEDIEQYCNSLENGCREADWIKACGLLGLSPADKKAIDEATYKKSFQEDENGEDENEKDGIGWYFFARCDRPCMQMPFWVTHPRHVVFKDDETEYPWKKVFFLLCRELSNLNDYHKELWMKHARAGWPLTDYSTNSLIRKVKLYPRIENILKQILVLRGKPWVDKWDYDEVDDRLWTAIRNREMKQVESAVKAGANMEHTRGGFVSLPNFPMQVALKLPYEAPLLEILICFPDRLRMTPNQSYQLIVKLLELGANANGSSADTESDYTYDPAAYATMLMLAVIKKRATVAQALIKHGADVNDTSYHFKKLENEHPATWPIYGYSALTIAVTDGNLEMTNLLLDSGANPNERSRKYNLNTALFEAVASVEERPLFGLPDDTTTRLEVVRSLLKHGANPNIPGKNGVLPLDAAVRTGQLEVEKLLKRYGAVQTERGKRRFTPRDKQLRYHSRALRELRRHRNWGY